MSAIVTEQRVDWFRVLVDLKRLEFSHYAIEAHTGIPRESLRDWANRISEPRHSRGEKLLAFWCTVMNRPRESVPMFDPYSPTA